MTGQEWLACTDPEPMLEFLRRGRASDRKLRLFGCACCRLRWNEYQKEGSKRAVEVSERFADGAASLDELRTAHEAAEPYQTKAGYYFPPASAASSEAPERAWEFELPCEEEPYTGPRQVILVPPGWKGRYLTTRSRLLHEIFGNPFRPVSIDPAVLTWHDGTIPRLAQAIYEERQLPAGTFDPARMNVLADALLDAGCDNEEMIQHCRSEASHVRGCWVIDLLLSKS